MPTYVLPSSAGALFGAIDWNNDIDWHLLDSKDPIFGAIVPRTSTVPSSLLDGTIVVHDSDDNRTLEFDVAYVARTATNKLGVACARVDYELEKQNKFTYSPMNGDPASVYLVQDSTWEYTGNANLERNGIATYHVKLTCLPYVIATAPVTDAALVGTGASSLSIDDGTSATNWTSTLGSITAGSGVLTLPVGTGFNSVTNSPTFHLNAKKTFASTDFSTRPFVSWDIQLPTNADMNTVKATLTTINAALASANATYVGATPGAVSGYTTVWFYFATPQSNATSITFDFFVDGSSGSGTTHADNLVRTGSAPSLPGGASVSTMRHINVRGSKRTPGTLSIDLGYTPGSSGLPWMAYSGPNLGYGGAYNPLVTATPITISRGGTPSSVTYTIPVAGLPPGGYLLVADLAGAVSGAQTVASPVTLSWAASQSGAPTQTAMTGSKVYETTLLGSVASFSRRMSTLGPMTLPLGDVAVGSSATISLTFTPGGSPASLFTLNAVFLLYMGPGAALTMQSVPPNRYVFIDSPDIFTPRPRVRCGSLADGSNAVSQIGNLSSVMSHVFTPPIQALVVYSGQATVVPTVGLSHIPAGNDWMSQ